MTTAPDRTENSRINRILNGVEKAGNKLPEPFMLFLGLFVLVAVISTLAGGESKSFSRCAALP